MITKFIFTLLFFKSVFFGYSQDIIGNWILVKHLISSNQPCPESGEERLSFYKNNTYRKVHSNSKNEILGSWKIKNDSIYFINNEFSPKISNSSISNHSCKISFVKDTLRITQYTCEEAKEGTNFYIKASTPEKYYLGQTDAIRITEASEYKEVDSLIFHYGGPNYACYDMEVYYDKSMNHIGYKSYQKDSFCNSINYWRNGKIKDLEVHKIINGFPIWWCRELYCENGQLLFKGRTANQPGKKHYINYYCNGNKKNEFDHKGWSADGKMQWWYESGQLKSEFYFENSKKEKEGKYYSESGKLIKSEFYKNDSLIKTKEY